MIALFGMIISALLINVYLVNIIIEDNDIKIKQIINHALNNERHLQKLTQFLNEQKK